MVFGFCGLGGRFLKTGVISEVALQITDQSSADTLNGILLIPVFKFFGTTGVDSAFLPEVALAKSGPLPLSDFPLPLSAFS
jgi:hypothetical protein